MSGVFLPLPWSTHIPAAVGRAMPLVGSGVVDAVISLFDGLRPNRLNTIRHCAFRVCKHSGLSVAPDCPVLAMIGLMNQDGRSAHTGTDVLCARGQCLGS